MATDIKKLAEELVGLTVLEVNELKNTLKDEYGIEPAAAAVAVLLVQLLVATLPLLKKSLSTTWSSRTLVLRRLQSSRL
jgi:ribosomal protein L7/L12